MKNLYEYSINPLTGDKKSVFNLNFGPKLFVNGYTIDHIVLKSNQSVVYVVTKKKTKEKYICKEIPLNNFKESEYIIPNHIESDRIIKVLDIVQANIKGVSKIFMFMEYYPEVIDGFDYLDVYIGDVTENKIKPLIEEMCRCIKDCHDAGYCHGDIKLENIIITEPKKLKVKLIDFEFSFLDNNKDTKFHGGTKRYIAPEVDRKHRGSRSSDIWSIGAVIYYIIFNKTYIPYTKICKLNISDELYYLLSGCLQIDPTCRFTIDEILESAWIKKQEPL